MHGSDRHGGAGLPAAAHVSVPRQTLRLQGENITRGLRQIHLGRNPLRRNLHQRGVCLGPDRSLGPDGLHGDGTLCGVHSLCQTAEPQGLHAAPLRAAALRRVLGLLLAGEQGGGRRERE